MKKYVLVPFVKYQSFQKHEHIVLPRGESDPRRDSEPKIDLGENLTPSPPTPDLTTPTITKDLPNSSPPPPPGLPVTGKRNLRSSSNKSANPWSKLWKKI